MYIQVLKLKKRNTAEQHYVYCVTFLRNKIIFHMFALKSLYRSFFCVLLSYSKKKKNPMTHKLGVGQPMGVNRVRFMSYGVSFIIT